MVTKFFSVSNSNRYVDRNALRTGSLSRRDAQIPNLSIGSMEFRSSLLLIVQTGIAATNEIAQGVKGLDHKLLLVNNVTYDTRERTRARTIDI